MKEHHRHVQHVVIVGELILDEPRGSLGTIDLLCKDNNI